ncbi:MAG: hypothetical protein AAF656_02775 [Planctomycetota bacterium]
MTKPALQLAADRRVPLIAGEYAAIADVVVADTHIRAVTSDDVAALLREPMKNLPGFVWHAGSPTLLTYHGGWPFDLTTHRPTVGLSVAEHEPYGPGDEVIREMHEISARVLGDGKRLWIWDFTPWPG